jgi:hypothetical protein
VISRSGAFRQAYSPAASNINWYMPDLSLATFQVLLSDRSSKVKACPARIEAAPRC